MSDHRPPERPAESSAGRPEGSHERAVSERVVDELAAARGIAPIEMDRPLADAVDPDALDALFAPRHDGSPRTGECHVEFSTDSYRVVVRKDGEVRLRTV